MSSLTSFLFQKFLQVFFLFCRSIFSLFFLSFLGGGSPPDFSLRGPPANDSAGIPVLPGSGNQLCVLGYSSALQLPQDSTDDPLVKDCPLMPNTSQPMGGQARGRTTQTLPENTRRLPPPYPPEYRGAGSEGLVRSFRGPGPGAFAAAPAGVGRSFPRSVAGGVGQYTSPKRQGGSSFTLP